MRLPLALTWGGAAAVAGVSIAASCVPSYEFVAPSEDGGSDTGVVDARVAVDGGSDAAARADAPPPDASDASAAAETGPTLVVLNPNEYQGEACALVQGVYRCWGDPNANAFGELGFSNPTDGGAIVPPIAVPPSSNGAPSVLALGAIHSCALYGRAVYCRGAVDGRGNPSSSNGPAETAVLGLPDGGVDTVATGWATSCAVTTSGNGGSEGSLYCWGANDYGVCGRPFGGPDTTLRAYPVLITPDGGTPSTIPDARIVALSSDHACAATASAVYCWGSGTYCESGPSRGSVCDATYGVYCNTSPQVVPLVGEEPIGLALGFGHSCVLTALGNVYCWGEDDEGQVGVPGASVQSCVPANSDAGVPCAQMPVKVPVLPPMRAIAAGAHHTCGIDMNQHVWCWGQSSEGQLGGGDNVRGNGPLEVKDAVSQAPIVADAITAGGLKSCAHTTSGVVLCWGAGELATEMPDASPPDQNYPQPVRF